MRVCNTEITVVRGSACDLDGDVLVNATNRNMRGGGGIDGEIHRRCGSELMYELSEKAPNGAETAEPVITHAYGSLSNFKNIIHVAGPIWDGTEQVEKSIQLFKCYWKCLTKAVELGVDSIVLPSISTGVYNFPLELAARIAIEATKTHCEVYNDKSPKNIIFAMYGEREYYVFSQTLAGMESESEILNAILDTIS